MSFRRGFLFLCAAALLGACSSKGPTASMPAEEPIKLKVAPPAPSEGVFELRDYRISCMKNDDKSFYFLISEDNGKGERLVEKADSKFLPNRKLDNVPVHCKELGKGIECRFGGKHPLKIASLLDVRSMRKAGWREAPSPADKAAYFSSQARARGFELSCYLTHALEDLPPTSR